MSDEMCRNAGGMMIASLAIGVFLLSASGCARSPDWIESTLVTVDVTGVWQGDVARAGSGGGSIGLMLHQSGPKVTGNLMGSSSIGVDVGPIDGIVSGDTFRFRSLRGGATGELQVNGDEMTGTGTILTQGGGTQPVTFTLRRQP